MGIGNNYSIIGPARGATFVFYLGLVSQDNPKILQSNPTIAEGDAKVSIDGAGFNNLDTTPAVTPAAGKAVRVSLSAAEMDGDNITVLFSDAAGDEWCDQMIDIQTGSGAAQSIEVGTVDDTVAPTTTEFESADITEATENHYFGRAVIFVSGALAKQAATIQAYALSGGKGHFTVTLMTEAPSDGDKFLII